MLASASLDKLWRLAKTLADRVDREMKGEQAKLLEVAKGTLVEALTRRNREDPADIPSVRRWAVHATAPTGRWLLLAFKRKAFLLGFPLSWELRLLD